LRNEKRESNVRIFKDKTFARFARRQRISDKALCDAIERAERGLIDADLGAGVIKQRIARPGEGKSGGFRTIIFFRVGERAFFVLGFAKNELANIGDDDLKILKRTAQATLAFTAAEIETLLKTENLIEINCDEDL